MIIATVLLVVATIVAIAALVISSVPALAGATVFTVLAGVGAVALMSAEIVVVRRLWAYDRAKVSDSYRNHTLERHQAHQEFVQNLGAKLQSREAQIEQIQEALLTSEIETALARERLSEEKARVAGLQGDAQTAASDLESARADLLAAQDELAASEAAGVAARAEIVAWQESSEASAKTGRARTA